MTKRFLCETIICLLGLAASAPAQQVASGPQQAKHFEAKIRVAVRLDYLLFLPQDYAKSKKSWPLMLFLHGAGESGTNLARVKALGPPKIVASKPDFPFILVSPQSPRDGW